ncbi:MAG: sigma-54-dependent Fis family transcriptional regulator [Betaproteobacteria bacterium HGW-Betaproteobacteria-2]|nr:MAG: sigma-54-dependent Fis family transcriptional regulator [Betaproteobacteria bacterium HGW-Betaproteobacteria-2]
MNMKPACLVVDDETDIRELLVLTLERMGISTDSAADVDDAKFLLSQRHYALCLTDMRLPDGNGLDLVKHINSSYPGLPVAVITAYGSADNAVSALKAGAFDYLSKPISLNQLRPLVQSALKLPTPQTPSITNPAMIGESPAMVQVRNLIEKLARSQAPVHICGEPGSGKELAARLIHRNSSRQEGPFISVNCGAIAENLMEGELFGYKKGAVANAQEDKPGLFQAANGGTIYLDEVADLPLSMQVKLLRVIQEKKVRMVGDQHDVSVDVRIISATHRNLGVMMEHGRFRQDLYYRLNVIGLKVPALRDRQEDIPLLTTALLEKLSRRTNLPPPSVNSEAMRLLKKRNFPGNVRELENILERALALCDGKTIGVDDLLLDQEAAGTLAPPLAIDNGLPLPAFLENIEKTAILNALEKTRNNKTEAAKLLGVSFRTLRYRLSKLGLGKDQDD